MILKIVKLFCLLLFFIIVALFYYFQYGHLSSFSGFYFLYIVLLVVIIGVYNFYLSSTVKETESVSIYRLVWVFLGHLLLIIGAYFIMKGGSSISSILANTTTLFFSILLYSLPVISIIFIITSFGRKVFSYVPQSKETGKTITFIASLNLGFISFITLLVGLGFIGQYNIYGVLGILTFFAILSYKECQLNFQGLHNYKIERNVGGNKKIAFISEQVSYFIFCFILATALVLIVRPFPIGWDDLGVYMNFPKELANAGSLLPLGTMYAWQMFTGVGYMFGGVPTFAFFFNISSVFLAFISLTLILSEFGKKYIYKEKEMPLVSFPIILSTIFISLPMIVFQTSKDMKLDIALFTFTIGAIYMLFSYIMSEKKEKKMSMWYILIIGIILGFAFSVKVTSLLLIIGVLAVLSYARLGVFGALGFFSVFISLMSLFDVWHMMNVVINPTNIDNFSRNVAFFTGILALLFYVISFFGKLRKYQIGKYVKEIAILLVGIIIALFPWFAKHIQEISPNITINGIISGKSDAYNLNEYLPNIYSQEKIGEINKHYRELRTKENAITTNEDLLRYFGYEGGILNYVFLPWNLTMQVNQKGEFTDISYLFLVLLPLVFVFLAFRHKYFSILFIVLPFFFFILVMPENPMRVSLEKLPQLSEKKFEQLFIKDTSVLDKLKSIKLAKYTSIPEGKEKEIQQSFFNMLLEKVVESDMSKNIGDSTSGFELDDTDFAILQAISKEFHNSFIFGAKNIGDLKTGISDLSSVEQEQIISVYRSERSFQKMFIDLFSEIRLPYGYIVVLFAFLLPLIYLLSTLKKSERNDFFMGNIIFAVVYVFLWTISSFGIVWYGIAMYFSFFVLIYIALARMSSYEEKNEGTELQLRMVGAFIVFVIFGTYMFISAIPQSISNMKSEGFAEYKSEQIKYPYSTFVYRASYLEVLFQLNIQEDKRKEFLESKLGNLPVEYQKTLQEKVLVNGNDIDMRIFVSVLYQLGEQQPTYKLAVQQTLDAIYSGILNPEPKYRNTEKIYRVGTFLKYYISENYNRLLEDSLLFNFNDYIYDENLDTTIDRLKKLDISYILVDLNAATIDKSETHDLTMRYEKMLELFTSNQLELVSTDSVCLRTGIELYKNKKDIEEYFILAGGNYESYRNGKFVRRGQKLQGCRNFVGELFKDLQDIPESFSFLEPYKGKESMISSGTYAIFKIQ